MKLKFASKALMRCIAPVLLTGGLAAGAFAAEMGGEIYKVQRNAAGLGGGTSTGTVRTLRFTVGGQPNDVFYGSIRNFRPGYQKIRYYPAPITDLAAQAGSGYGEVALTWTAPGADGNVGTAGDYKVAWSTEGAITDDLAFEAARHYSGSFVPLAAGSTETHTISGLPTGKTVYFAVKTAEPGGNLSAVSNTASASAKAPASVAGTVSYSGTQAGRITAAVVNSSDNFSAAEILSSTYAAPGGAYSLPEVQPEVQVYLMAFVDMNQSGAYDEGEDYGAYGGAEPTALNLAPGEAVADINFSIVVASTAHLGTITGGTSYTGAQSGTLRIEAYSDSSFSGQPVAALSTAPTGAYSFVLPGDQGYYLRAYIDADGDASYDPGEAYGLYDPLGQGAQAIYVARQETVAGKDIAAYDPGCSADGCAGQGTASINISTTSAGGQVSFKLSLAAGAAGMQDGAAVSFGVPRGWGPLQSGTPAGDGYVSVTALTAGTGTVSLDDTPFTGRYSATARLTDSLSAGDTVQFAISKLSVPCLTGVSTFSVTSAQAAAVDAAPLSSGSPGITVGAGGAVSVYFTPPTLTLTQYATSQALVLTGKDLCGRNAAVSISTDVQVSARQYSFNTGTFDAASDLKVSSYSAGGFAASGAVPFAAGRSTASLYAVASATGSRHIRATYQLDGSERNSYCAVNVLQGNPFSGVNVSSGAFATSVLSITITPDGDGSADMAFINFTLADASLSWKVEIASVSFASGGGAVWQAVGSGSASPGRVAWDGRLTLGTQAGKPAPAGTYYVRITAGGISNTSARITVLSNRISGQVTDPGITPAVPIPDVKVQAYGPVAAQAVTDSAGRYSLAGLAVGTYTVTFAKNQYVSASTTVVIAGTSTALNMPLSRAPVLTVIPSLQAGATQSYEQWGGIAVFNSDWTRNLTVSMRLPAGTTTFDDGGQWDVSLQQFVTRNRFRFEVAPDTYTALAWLSGYYPSSATVHVGAAGYQLQLPDITRRVSISGAITLSTATNPSPNPSGLQVSVVAVAGDTAGGSTLVDLAPGASTGTYTIYGVEAGTYTIRATVPGFQGVSSGPVVVSLTDMTGVDLPAFGEGGSIRGTLTVDGDTTGFGSISGSTSPISVRITAWSERTASHGRDYVNIYKNAVSDSDKYLLTGLTPGDTYYIFSEITYNSDDAFYSPGGFPKTVYISTQSQAASYSFSFAKASGTVLGLINLPNPATEIGAPAIDFTQAPVKWTITRSKDPNRVGLSYEVASSTSLPGFLCAGTTASTGTAPGCAAGVSSAAFSIGGLRTETLELVFNYGPTGFTRTLTLAAVNGSTTTASVDARGDTYNIAGSIINQISDPLFNTNALIAANAPFSALTGYPAGISSTTARVEAIRRDFGELQTRVSTTTFDAAKTRVGVMDSTGNYIVTGLQNGVYLVRTLPLRAYATGPVLVPGSERVVTIANSSRTGVNFTLADGFSVSGSVALDDGLSDARNLRLTLRNTRGETVDTQDLLLGNPGAGVPASSADFLFERVPGGNFYTLHFEDLDSPVKYVSRVLFFPDRTSSPDGLQGDETGLELPLKQAGFITGKLRDVNSGELITGENATLLASNFYIYAVASPWVDGGYAVAASSVSGRPIEADGTFRIGPLPPAASYDVYFRQRSWDIAYLSAGSQNYAPARSAQNYLTSGEIKDIGIIGLNQGQSITGTVSGPSGEGLPNITMTAVPALTESVATVETQTDADGSYTLWVSTYISRWFDLTAAAREDNLAAAEGGTLYGGQTIRVDLNSSTSAYFTLRPLEGKVTGQVLAGDGGALSYPFGDQKGFPAAAVYLQPENTIPEDDWMGDISAMTATDGTFEVPGLSTGVYTMNVVSLGYVVNTSSITVTTGTVPAGTITLSRGASVLGALRKSDPDSPTGYSCPNDEEVVGVAAADQDFGEFLVGTVETDPTAHTVCAYEITGFVPGLNYHIALLGPTGTEIDFPPEGAVSFGLQESTSTKLANLTYRAPEPGCVPRFKYLGSGQVQLKFTCNRSLRNETGLDNDLDYIMTVSTYAADGTPFTSPNGGGEFLGADKRLQDGRKNLTAVYRPATDEARFTVRLRGYTAELDPSTGRNYLIDELYDFYTAVDASRSRSISNIHGGKLEMEAGESDDQVENTSVAMQPGAFVVDGSTYAQPGTSVQLGMNKGRTREQVEVQSFVPGAVTPQDAARVRSLESYPPSMAEAIKAIRDQRVSGFRPSASGGNAVSPFSAFYDIFLPAGIRRELREKARLTLTYDASLSSASPMNLNIWYYNTSTQRYVLESDGREIDTVNHTVSALVDHFSTFVVLASSPVYTSTSPYNGGDLEAFNFPNPFNLETKTKDINLNAGGGSYTAGVTQVTTRGTIIRVGVPRSVSGNGSLRIYTLAGELVREYDCGWIDGSAGPSGSGTYYYFEWDGRNSEGSDVASDVYFGEFKVGDEHKFWKMAVVKDSRYR